MKTKTGLIFTIIVLLFSVSCIFKKGLVDPKTVILPLGDTIHVIDGSIVYGLPLTVFEVIVEMEKRTEKPGPYARFATDLLGIKDIISQEKEIWSINGIKVNSYEELDPSEFYIIESNTLFETNVLKLKKSGLILDLNPDIFEKHRETGQGKASVNFQREFMNMGADEYYVSQSDTAFRLVNVDTTFIKIPYLVEKKKQLTIDQLADRAAKSLLELRNGKHLILTGEANIFPQDKSAFEEMNRLESDYLALFAGKTWTETKTFSYTLIPHKNMAGKQVTIFKFSGRDGPAASESAAGIPVAVQLLPVQKTKDLTVIENKLQENEPVKKFDKLFYRLPEVVTVNVRMGEEILFKSRKLIYQFGETMQLPANYIIGR